LIPNKIRENVMVLSPFQGKKKTMDPVLLTPTGSNIIAQGNALGVLNKIVLAL